MNLLKYLQGNNPHLKGTIYSFKKGWRVERDSNYKHGYAPYYSIILYFDHEHARISRYLINIGAKTIVKNNIVKSLEEKFPLNEPIFQNITTTDRLLTDFYGEIISSGVFMDDFINKYTLESEYKTLVDISFLHDDKISELKERLNKGLNYSIMNNTFNFNFFNINDGKLTAKFFNMFISEFFRDGFAYNQYNFYDMQLLRFFNNSRLKHTIPLKLINEGPNITLIEDYANITSEKYNIYNKSLERELIDLFTPIKVKGFQAIPDKNMNTHINIPQDFLNKNYNNIFKKAQIELKPYKFDQNQPQCMKDLKSLINSHTVLDIFDLNNKIQQFNLKMAIKVSKGNKSEE